VAKAKKRPQGSHPPTEKKQRQEVFWRGKNGLYGFRFTGREARTRRLERKGATARACDSKYGSGTRVTGLYGLSEYQQDSNGRKHESGYKWRKKERPGAGDREGLQQRAR